MNKKSFFVNTNGKFIRYTELEVIQTFYNLTKGNPKISKPVSKEDANEWVMKDAKDISFDDLVTIFGHMDREDGTNKPLYNPEDTLTIPVGMYNGNKEPIKTTIGRLVFNKVLYQKPGLEKEIGYINEDVTEGKFFGTESKIGKLLMLDKFQVSQMYDYVDTRDWLGLQLHALITPSFTPDTIKIHPEVQKLKDELFKKYEKELESGDARIAEIIEKQLLDKTKEVFKDDPGMDLYNSGARGSLSNNYKNIALMRGAVYNRATKKYEVVKNSLNDGLKIKDIPVSANTILEGAYPKKLWGNIW